VIISGSVSDEDAKALYPAGWKTVEPYLRVVAQPN
jgi:thioredoxin-dependent peroxiredoxin